MFSSTANANVSADRSPASQASSCALCASRHACWASQARVEDSWYAEFHFAKRRIARGATLFRMGEGFDSLYAVRSGMFKTSVLLEDGREQVTAFKMSGEMLGLDGIGMEQYTVNAAALEDSEVCVIPYARIVGLWRELPSLASEVNRMLSREIVRDQALMALLGNMQAQERVIALLLDLARRFAARGYADNQFLLRMTREEIGSYLGLKLETVSRVLSRLQAASLIDIEQNRIVRLLEPDQLRALIGAASKLNYTRAAQRPSLRPPVIG